MPLIILVMAAGLFIEILGTIISVTGVAASFNGNLLIIAFVLALDIGKIAVISGIYQYWERATLKFRLAAPFFIIVTMVVSSFGAYGYFSSEFEKSMVGTRDVTVKVEALKSQLARYEVNKQQIDAQMAAIPEKTSVNQRMRMINAFKDERAAVMKRIADIESQLPELEAAQISSEAKTGPILALSKTLDVPVETALKMVVGLLISVFNPFAVFLIYLGNFMLKLRKEEKTPEPVAEPIDEAPPAHVAEPVNAVEIPEAVEPPVEVVETFPVSEAFSEAVVLDTFVETPEVVVEPVAVLETAETPAGENVAEPLPEGTLLNDTIVEEPVEVLTPREAKAREKRVSLLLDKALDSVIDNTTISATPLVDVQAVRSTYSK